MSIKYALFENNATSDPKNFRAVVQITESVDLNQLATELAAGSTFRNARYAHPRRIPSAPAAHTERGAPAR